MHDAQRTLIQPTTTIDRPAERYHFATVTDTNRQIAKTLVGTILSPAFIIWMLAALAAMWW